MRRYNADNNIWLWLLFYNDYQPEKLTSRLCTAIGCVFCRRCSTGIDVALCKKDIVQSEGRVSRLESWRVWVASHVWLDMPQAVSGNLNFGLFFSGFRQWRGWINGILTVVRMLLFECVFRLGWKILFAFRWRDWGTRKHGRPYNSWIWRIRWKDQNVYGSAWRWHTFTEWIYTKKRRRRRMILSRPQISPLFRLIAGYTGRGRDLFLKEEIC